jgi:hypothetical protein
MEDQENDHFQSWNRFFQFFLVSGLFSLVSLYLFIFFSVLWRSQTAEQTTDTLASDQSDAHAAIQSPRQPAQRVAVYF